MSNNKVRFVRVDTAEVDAISITQVAEDWGVQIYDNGNMGHSLYCPNPNHNDTNLGNCNIVERNGKNFFNCFACGMGGGPIKLVMLIDDIGFIEAREKIAKKYGLIRFEDINRGDLPPRWEGLSHEEYKSLGLRDVSVKIPQLDRDGKVVYAASRVTLRNLARDNPELHDEILIGKMVECFYGLAIFQQKVREGEFEDFKKSGDWEGVVEKIAENYKALLKKGLVDKERVNDVFLSREEKIKEKLKDQIRNSLKKQAAI